MSTTDRLHLFLGALHDQDGGRVRELLSLDVSLRSPIFEDPFQGRDVVAGVLMALMDTLDEFSTVNILSGGDHYGVFLKIRLGAADVNGMDYMHLNEAGLVDEMTIMWRPLPAVVAIQNALAPKLGVPALILVPQS